jgi:hypothetical protein
MNLIPDEELSESNIERMLAMKAKALKIYMTLPESVQFSYEEYTDLFFA